MSDQPTLGDMFKGLNARQTIEYQELVDAFILEGGPEFAVPLMLTSTDFGTVEKLDTRLDPVMKVAIQAKLIAPGIARRLAKLTDDELQRAEQTLITNHKLTGDDLDNLRQVTRQEAVAPLADLFREDPETEIKAALDALVKRYVKVPVEVWEHLFEHALEDHHPDAYHFEGDDGDVIGQIIAAEGDEEIAPALELNDLTWLRELELEQQPST